ncbi:hypothetical protein ES703_114308 [subsurface metagenome]
MMGSGIRFMGSNKSRGVLVDGRQAGVSCHYSSSDGSSLSIGVLLMVSVRIRFMDGYPGVDLPGSYLTYPRHLTPP